jgi:hypothetical protein
LVGWVGVWLVEGVTNRYHSVDRTDRSASRTHHDPPTYPPTPTNPLLNANLNLNTTTNPRPALRVAVDGRREGGEPQDRPRHGPRRHELRRRPRSVRLLVCVQDGGCLDVPPSDCVGCVGLPLLYARVCVRTRAKCLARALIRTRPPDPDPNQPFHPSPPHPIPPLPKTPATRQRKLPLPFLGEMWDREFPTGQDRYYSASLTLLGMLHISGKFKAYY